MERPDSLDTTDVDGATSRPLPVRLTAHPFNTNADIESSTPFRFSQGRFKSGRQTDALNPAYKLPSFAAHPLGPADPVREARDILWTMPQRRWRPEPRAEPVQTAAEKFGRTHFFQQTVAARPSMVSVDITGPQFRIEEPRNRTTDPLMPSYLYDGAHSEQVATRRPHYGSQFTRTVEENYNLRTDDILTEKIFNREYPKALIQTRPSNRTDDITGAQADTRCSAPKLWKIRDPLQNPQKLTNRVMDIEGAVAGTGGMGPPLYRTRKQAAMLATADFGASMGSSMRASTAAATARAADIASVAALP